MIKKSILFIDDEEILRLTLGTELQAAGYKICTVADGEEGLRKLQDNAYDLVLTDQVMGNVDGIQILRAAKQLHQDIAVIILTGYGDLFSAIDALRLGADDYLLKPCNLDELKLRIAKALEKKEMRQKIKLYENILSICSVCSKIRDDEGREPGTGDWLPASVYITRKTKVRVSHGLCQHCYEQALKAIGEE
jgi:DNA-binding NtrC family response regulator